MGNDATKIFGSILDNSANITTEIRNEVYQLLGINTQSVQLTEFVKECLEKFSFNVVEKQFLEQIKNIIIEEINKNDLKIKNNEKIDYELFSSNMIEKLRQVKIEEFYLEDELKELADLLASRFPQSNISRDQLYSHFISKKEQIGNMINKHNQNIVETLIKFTPQLSSELSQQAKANQKITESPKSVNTDLANGSISVEQFLSRCTEKLNEVNLMFENGSAVHSKSTIAKSFRQLKKFIESLNDRTFAQEILDRYIKLNEAAQSVIYDKIIFENVPSLKELYEKSETLSTEQQIAHLKNNLGDIFEQPVNVQESQAYTRGGSPRELAVESTGNYGIPRNNLSQTESVFQVSSSKQPESQQDERQLKDKLVQQIIGAMNNAGELSFGEISFSERMDRMSNIRNGLYNKSVEELEVLLSAYQVGKKENKSVEPYHSEQTYKTSIQVSGQNQLEQQKDEQQLKDKLVQQIIGAMNNAGELAFGEISFSERMDRMNNIRNRLSNKSIEDLQTLLATYQDQTMGLEEQHTTSMRR